MKKLIPFLFVLICARAFAANIQIENITTTIVLPASNTYMVASGTTQGTNKVLMSGFTFVTTTRATLAALSITSIVDGAAETVLGASSAGDGGGATYFWSASSTATPNGNTVILPSSAPGTGRWLKAAGGVGVPGPTTLGGVFSNAGSTNLFVSGINTDGSLILTQPSISNITGLGSMASQNSSAVAISGGTIGGVSIDGSSIGATTVAPAAFSTISSTGNVTFGNAGGNRTVNLNGGSTTGQGAAIIIQRSGATAGFVGTDSGLNGSASSDIDIGGYVGNSLNFYANNVRQGSVTTAGLNGMAIGATTPATGAFSTLTATGGITNTDPTASAGATGTFTRNSKTFQIYSGASQIQIGTVTNDALGIFINNGSTVALFTATGLNATAIGATTPAAATFTTVNWSSNANIRTTKANGHITINVSDFGAVGNGSTDDTAAINAAIAATPSYGTLFFAPGKYRITSGLTAFDSVVGITITGLGAEIYNDSGASGANTIVVNNTCSGFDINNLNFTGTATVRGNGIHIRIGASHSRIHDCFFSGCSDFAVLVSYGSGGWCSDVNVSNCTSYQTLGDGFHFGSVVDSSCVDCHAINTGDDGLGIVADTAANPPNRIEVVGFTSIQAGNPGSGGTHGCGIRIVDGCVDVHIVGGEIYQPAEAGIYIGRGSSTTAYNARIKIDGLKVFGALQVSGMIGGVNITFTNQAELNGVRCEAVAHASSFGFLDVNDLTVMNCVSKTPILRAYAADDGTTTNVASNWSNWVFSNNTSLGTPSNEIYYLTPATGKTITNLIITGNTEIGASASNYIFTNRLAGTCKINNNTSLGGKAIANGGSGATPILANNN